MTLEFIPDGYTLDGYIAEVPGLHGALRFVYRPCTASENAVTGGAVDKVIRQSPAKAERIVATGVCKQLVSWSVQNPKTKEAVDIVPATAVRLQPALFAKLFDIIRGARASDVDPNIDDKGKPNEQNEIDALLADVDAETTPEGNSPAG